MQITTLAALAAGACLLSVSIASAAPATLRPACGAASWYALHSRTASGERMDPAAMTAAHKTLKLGSHVRVTNLRNGRSVIVRINDRGPFVRGRLIDLSRGAAQRLGFVEAGHARVRIEPADARPGKVCA